MPPVPRSRPSLLLLIGYIGFLILLNPEAPDAATIAHLKPSTADQALDCIHHVYGKVAIEDVSVDTKLLIGSCPNSRSQLSSVLESRGLRIFESDDSVFIIPAKFFPPRPPDLSPYIKTLTWRRIKFVFKVRSSPEISEAQAEEIKKQVFLQARLIPLEVSLLPASGDEVSVDMNVFILVGKPTPDGAKPLVAWVNALPTFLTGRLIYGEMREGVYTMLWDSPLFNSRGQVYFRDVNADGRQEIVIQSQDCGNQCSDVIVIFDKDGRELTRQVQCDTFPDAFDEEDGVCAIKGDEISLRETAAGATDIVVVNSKTDSKDHVFKLQNGMFAAIPGTNAPRTGPHAEAIAVSEAAKLNEQGMQKMKERNYGEAAARFIEAINHSSDSVFSTALFANNAGFAFYKMEKYEESVTWFKKAIEIDPKRAVAYVNLGDALAKLNRNGEARQAYTKYLELAPQSKSASDAKKKLDSLSPSP